MPLKECPFFQIFEPVEQIFNTQYFQGSKLGVQSMVGVVVLATRT